MSPDPILPFHRLPGPGGPPVPHLVATFVYDLPEDRWSWSTIGGSPAGGPLVDGVHGVGGGGGSGGPGREGEGSDGDGDRSDVAEHLEGVVAAAMCGGPVVYRNSVTDVDGFERDVLVLAESDRDEAGPLTGLRGFVFDLVVPRAASPEDELLELRVECDLLWQALRDADVIGQAKGVILASCGCTADVASDVLDELVHRSGLTMREVCEWLVRSSGSGQGSLAEALESLGLSGDR